MHLHLNSSNLQTTMTHLLPYLQSLLQPLPQPHLPPSSQQQQPPILLPNSSSLHLPNLSRRDLAIAAAAAICLPLPAAFAANDNLCGDLLITKRTFIDVSIDGAPAGRITIGLYGDAVPVGAARFAALVSGAAGISYRRKEFTKITPTYIQHAGVRSYGADADLARRGSGSDVSATSNELLAEWERCKRGAVERLSVGLVVRDPTKPPAKAKLVARKGKLEVDEEEVRPDPNGTEFVVATEDDTELAEAALVIGRVVDGVDVVKKVASVKAVQDNTGSPYFR